MAELILQMNLSINAYAADSQGKLDWMLTEEDDRHIKLLNKLTEKAGHIILGRKMAQESVPYWEKVARDSYPSKESGYARYFVNTPKTVFSKTLESLAGTNVHIERSHLNAAVRKLKQASQKDIIVYGGASFVSSLIASHLIDELNLFFHPVALASGLKIFTSKTDLELTDSQSYTNGIVYNQFRLT